MLFSSPLFLFLFLPFVLGIHFIVRSRFRNGLLLAASVAFYCWGEGAYVLIMLAIIAVNYALGLMVQGLADGLPSRLMTVLAVAVNLGLLIVFKYSNFLVDQFNLLLVILRVPPIALPPLDFALYMTFFPHAIAGPIVRYGDIVEQIRERIVTSAGFAEGVRRFIIGLAKKVLIANSVAVTADAIFALPASELNLGLSWLGIACYTLQIYFDFSGYSDMAIGLAKLFGIDFLENFNYPYAARSLTEFWRRWHISLSTWFRDYLYIPMGGNRLGPIRTYLNLLTVFILCGLWHGASWTFAAWGLFHGVFLVLERLGLDRIIESFWSPARHIYTILVVGVGWILFRADNLHHALAFLGAMAGLGPGAGLAYHPAVYLDKQVALALIAGVVGSTPVLPMLMRLRGEYLAPVSGPLRIALRNGLAVTELASLSLLLLTSAMFLAAGTYNPFIYFRF
jgi:alginate O-acetyltransferase complex protein AlgI